MPESARTVAFFDTMAAVLSALVIIPAMATAGETLTQSGPGLMFIYLPNLFGEMPGGRVLMAVFFVAALFAGVTSLVNLYEAPTATLQRNWVSAAGLRWRSSAAWDWWWAFASRASSPAGWTCAPSTPAPWGLIDIRIVFYWIWGREDCLVQVNLARRRPLGRWFYPTAKYVYCGVTVAVLVLGAVNGGIG